MSRITEQIIEEFTVELLESLGYKYIYGPFIAPDGEHPERESYEQVLLIDRLENAVRRINKSIPLQQQTEAIREIQRLNSPDLLTVNESFHKLLTEGIPVIKQVNGEERGDRVRLIDFDSLKNILIHSK